MTTLQKNNSELISMQKRIKEAYISIYGEERGSVPTTIESCKIRIKWFYDNLDYIV